MSIAAREIVEELRRHAPFTFLGAVSGVLLMLALAAMAVPHEVAQTGFSVFHPAHVLLSALVTAGIYRRHAGGRLLPTLLVGYVGAVAIGTLSDSLIPYLGEWLLGMPHAHPHIGFIEHWYVVNPLAVGGAVVGWSWPRTRVPHAGHVLLSTWASLFHMWGAAGESVSLPLVAAIAGILFLAVWLPCCMSDIVFPLLFTGEARAAVHAHEH